VRLRQIAEQLATEQCKRAARRPRRRLASLSGQGQRRVIDKRTKQWQTDDRGYQLGFQQAQPTPPDHQAKAITRARMLTDYFTPSGDPTDVVPHQKHC
jgi:hypothetical protein